MLCRVACLAPHLQLQLFTIPTPISQLFESTVSTFKSSHFPSMAHHMTLLQHTAILVITNYKIPDSQFRWTQ